MMLSSLRRWPSLYRVAMYNACFIPDTTRLSSAFCWDETIEGHNFWVEVDFGNLTKAKEMYPHLFEGGLT